MFPVEIEIEFEDGENITEQWDGKDLWKKYDYTRPAKHVAAKVGTDRKIPLELDWKNNPCTLKHQEKENKKGENYYIGVIKFILDAGI
jgi:hypothetical protein